VKRPHRYRRVFLAASPPDARAASAGAARGLLRAVVLPLRSSSSGSLAKFTAMRRAPRRLAATMPSEPTRTTRQ
jgi:hypothetical protein